MKKSFTLLETIISITIFMIMILFLYKVVDQTKFSNKHLADKKNILMKSNDLHNIFLEDIAESIEIKIMKDKEKNSIVKLVTKNNYHNPYNKNVTYMVNSSLKLVRIESSSVFENEKSDDFFENAYIDILLDNIEFFELAVNDLNYVFAIKQKEKDRVFYNTYKFGELK